MEASLLQVVWFLLFGVLIMGYAILDGFDLGVGVLHLFARDEGERRVHLNSIAPVWDGNEVWLLTGGGALFAAFPVVYSTVFSGFYLAFMLLLLALIARAVALEFRSKVESPAWKRAWDWAFGLGSLVPALLYGVAVGNVLRGLPMDASHWYTGTFLGLLNPFALVTGLLGLAAFVTHGALYLTLKSEGALQERVRGLASKAWMAWVALYVVATIQLFFEAPWALSGKLSNPLTWVLFLGLIAALVAIPLLSGRGSALLAFLASSLGLAAMTGLVGLSLFPRLVPALGAAGDLNASLTIMNSSSTPATLQTMLIIALIGVPIVLAYTVFIYRVFKGKVVIGEDSY
jgi:cytochrome d ubiquinol oxidase subunit II